MKKVLHALVTVPFDFGSEEILKAGLGKEIDLVLVIISRNAVEVVTIAFIDTEIRIISRVLEAHRRPKGVPCPGDAVPQSSMEILSDVVLVTVLAFRRIRAHGCGRDDLTARDGLGHAALVIGHRETEAIAIKAVLCVVAAAVLLGVDRRPIASLGIGTSRKLKRVADPVHVLVAQAISLTVETEKGILATPVILGGFRVEIACVFVRAPGSDRRWQQRGQTPQGYRPAHFIGGDQQRCAVWAVLFGDEAQSLRAEIARCRQ